MSSLQARKEGHESQCRGNSMHQGMEVQCLKIMEQCMQPKWGIDQKLTEAKADKVAF